MHRHVWGKWGEPYTRVYREPEGIFYVNNTYWFIRRECRACGRIKTKQISGEGL